MTTTVMALPSIMDPMYWLGEGGLFASAVLPGILVIVFIETGLLFPLLPGDSLLFTGGLLAAAPIPPVNIWVLVICVAVVAVLGDQCAYFIGRRIGPRVAGDDRREPVGMMDAEPVADHAADRKPDPVALLHAEMIPDAEHIIDEHRKRIGAGNRLAVAVAALVVAQHPVTVAELRGDLVPQRQIVRECVGQRDPGRAFRPFDDAVEGDAVRLDLHDSGFLIWLRDGEDRFPQPSAT